MDVGIDRCKNSKEKGENASLRLKRAKVEAGGYVLYH
jgi:hypothetical protein